MSPPGRPKGEYRSAKHGGCLMIPQSRLKAHTAVRNTEVAG